MYINKNIYCKISAIKSLMELWNLNPIPMCPLVTFVNYRKLASSQSNRHKYRLLQNHRCAQRAPYISISKFWYAALSHMLAYSIMEYVWIAMEFITLWTPGVKKQPNVYFLYSRMQMFVFNICTCNMRMRMQIVKKTCVSDTVFL